MESQEKALVAKLTAEYPERKALVEEHKAFKAQLEELNHRP